MMEKRNFIEYTRFEAVANKVPIGFSAIAANSLV